MAPKQTPRKRPAAAEVGRRSATRPCVWEGEGDDRLFHGGLEYDDFGLGVGRNIGVSGTSCSIRCSSECAISAERFPTARLECKHRLHARPVSAWKHPR